MSTRDFFTDATYQCGDKVYYRATAGVYWKQGVIVDMFPAPVSGRFVYVIDGSGYYEGQIGGIVEEPITQPGSVKA